MIRNNNINNTVSPFIPSITIAMEEHIDDNLNLFYQVSRLQQVQVQQRVQVQQPIQAQQQENKNYLTFTPYDFIVFDQMLTSQSPYNSLLE